MKIELFRCDYCEIEKFDSETQRFINIPFTCGTLGHWKQHIKRAKHCMAIARNNNLDDNLVKQCKHCDGVFTLEQYQRHKNHNTIYWISKNTNSEYYNECSCNNFIYNGKRFETLIELRTYAENRYENGRKKVEYQAKEKKIVSFEERNEKMEKIKEKIEERERKNYERKVAEKERRKNKKEQPNITIKIEEPKEKVEELSVEQIRENRLDLNIKPIFEDYCNDCGKADNFIANYPIEKLERWHDEIGDICKCGDSDDSDCE